MGLFLRMRTARAEVPAFTTKDGSTIRELMHPRAQRACEHVGVLGCACGSHAARHQSLAEATVPPGVATVLHRHARSEEIYHVLAGSGVMTLGRDELAVRAGDTVCIPPGTPHRIRNAGTTPLVFLCCCAPAYSDDDTELLE